MPLLGPDDPPPFSVRNPDANSVLLFTSDHNGVVVPQVLNGLVVPPNEMRRHVAYDIGIAAVAECLSERFRATLITANYSRLVIDCNRKPGSPDSIPEISDHTVVPANSTISESDRLAREVEIFEPYHQAITERITEMRAGGYNPVLVALHSFTPVIEGVFRPWDIGILWRDDDRLAGPIIEALSADAGISVGDNLPYSGRDRTGYTTAYHTGRLDLLHVGVEFRQDRIEFQAGARAWAARFGDVLAGVLDTQISTPRQVA